VREKGDLKGIKFALYELWFTGQKVDVKVLALGK